MKHTHTHRERERERDGLVCGINVLPVSTSSVDTVAAAAAAAASRSSCFTQDAKWHASIYGPESSHLKTADLKILVSKNTRKKLM